MGHHNLRGFLLLDDNNNNNNNRAFLQDYFFTTFFDVMGFWCLTDPSGYILKHGCSTSCFVKILSGDSFMPYWRSHNLLKGSRFHHSKKGHVRRIARLCFISSNYMSLWAILCWNHGIKSTLVGSGNRLPLATRISYRVGFDTPPWINLENMRLGGGFNVSCIVSPNCVDYDPAAYHSSNSVGSKKDTFTLPWGFECNFLGGGFKKANML